jgi:two-component system, cell cycle response regulator
MCSGVKAALSLLRVIEPNRKSSLAKSDSRQMEEGRMTCWPYILVVEDKAEQVALMAARLHTRFPSGRVVSAASGAEVEGMDLDPFDVILLGYNLPDCTGLDLIERIKPRVRAPLIIVTSLRSGDAAASAIRSGASDYLVKTEDYLDLLPVVVEKNLVTATLQTNVTRLQDELCQRYEELRQKNAELEAANSQLREMTLRDPLTGLYNRRYVNEVIEQFVARALRYQEDLACMMIDVDHFKRANDELGHLTGDRVLQIAGRSVGESIRGSDVAARFGGDEFVVLLPQSSSMDAYQCAERINERFRMQLAAEGPAATWITLSIGVASLGRGALSTARELIAAADCSMYACKAGGGNGVFPHLPTPVQTSGRPGWTEL